MSIEIVGKIKGFVSHKEIFNYIKQKFDINVKEFVTREDCKPLSEINFKYQINEHSDNDEI